MIKQILVALDGSSQSKKALLHASDLCRFFDAQLTIVNVLNSGHVPKEFLHIAEIENLFDLKESAEDASLATVPYRAESSEYDSKIHAIISQKIIEEAEQEASINGIENIKTIIERGDPADQILATADKIGADLIVMGSRGLGTLKGLLVGSVSQKVHALSKCTVTCMK